MIELTADERSYVLKRLDRTHILQVAGAVSERISGGYPVEACYQPGDGTWYSLVFVPLFAEAAVGGAGGGTNGSGPTSFLVDHERGRDILVYHSQRDRGAILGPDAEWTAAKLTDSKASALAIAELLRAVAPTEPS